MCNYKNDVDERDGKHWYLLRAKITFKEYMDFDTDIMTSELSQFN